MLLNLHLPHAPPHHGYNKPPANRLQHPTPLQRNRHGNALPTPGPFQTLHHQRPRRVDGNQGHDAVHARVEVVGDRPSATNIGYAGRVVGGG